MPWRDPDVLEQIDEEDVDGAQGYKQYLMHVSCDDLPINRLGPKLFSISSLLHRFTKPDRDVQAVMIYLAYAIRVVKTALEEAFPGARKRGGEEVRADFKIVTAYTDFYDQLLYDFSTLGIAEHELDAYGDAYEKLYDRMGDLMEVVGSWEREGALWTTFNTLLDRIMRMEMTTVEHTRGELVKSFLGAGEKGR